MNGCTSLTHTHIHTHIHTHTHTHTHTYTTHIYIIVMVTKYHCIHCSLHVTHVCIRLEIHVSCIKRVKFGTFIDESCSYLTAQVVDLNVIHYEDIAV